jgi:hypothetical protein
MDLKVALKRVLTVCVTTTILSTSMVLAKGKPATAPPENVPASSLRVEKRAGPVTGSTIDMSTIKSPEELKSAVKRALTNKAVAARVRAELGNVSYRMLRRALDDPKEPEVEVQVSSGFACWFACLRSAGVSIYSAGICAATCAVGLLPACVICAGISAGIGTLCAIICSYEVIGDSGDGDKAQILQ